MDESERKAAEQQRAVWEWVLAAQERRHEVIDLVWGATNEEQAAERLRELLGIEGVDSLAVLAVLDLRIGRLTQEARQQLAANVRNVRDHLGSA